MTLRPNFRSALAAERPLQIAGAVNAYAAMLAERAGFRALYVSGSGVATASFGLPDLGFTTREQVAEDVRRICAATPLPVLVDVDTGWDDPAETTRAMIAAGLIDPITYPTTAASSMVMPVPQPLPRAQGLRERP